MTAQLAPVPIFKAFDNNGFPLAFGQLSTYVAGTTTPQATYVDSTQTTQNTNPIQLNFRGECNLWLDPTKTYKFLLQDLFGNTIPGWPVDNIPGSAFVSASGSITIPANLIPTPTNTQTLGNPSFSWAQIYLGANAAPAYDSVSGNIGFYARTAAEIAASVTPTNYVYAPGDVRRYGADPTGVADSSTAFANAIASNSWVFDNVTNGGTYLINSALILKSILRISGVTKTIAGTTGKGTTIIVGSSVSNALLHATAFITDVEIDHITFTWANFTLAQAAIKFDSDARSIRIHDCAFIGSAVSSTQSIGINFVGGGTFTGDVSIYHNYITVVQVGIAFAGTCSTVRVTENEIYCNTAIPNSFGVNNVSSAGGGILIAFNTFESWNQAIQSTSGACRIIGNYFENDVTWDWNLGTSTNNYAALNTYTSTIHTNYLYNNTTANIVLDSGVGYFFDSGALNVYRGVIEQGRSVANGWFIVPTFSAGIFTGSGAMTWTVIAGNVATFEYEIVGNDASLNFFVSGTTIGGTPSTALQITLPVTATTRIRAPCSVINGNGTQGTGVMEILASSSTLKIYLDATQTTNWTAGASGGVSGQIKIRIA